MVPTPRSVLRAVRRLPRVVRHIGRHQRGRCALCGRDTVFLVEGDNLKESLACLHCGAWLRLRLIAGELVRRLGAPGTPSLAALAGQAGFRGLRIWEAQASGPIHDALKSVPGYVGTEFLSGVAPGTTKGGVRCEDMQRLTFADGAFDLVLHSSVLEHVRKPFEALRECTRVLAPGGWLVFEVPMTDPGAPEIRPRTVARVDTSGPEDVHVLPPAYHDDPLSPDGVLVYTDFGLDLREELEGMGLDVDVRSQELPDSTMRHAVVWVCRKR